jgi:hypothetical protein
MRKPKAPPNHKYQGAFCRCAGFPLFILRKARMMVMATTPMAWLKMNETDMADTSPNLVLNTTMNEIMLPMALARR